MSGGLKSIELQVALPRTQTAGKLQDQMQQRSTVAQDQLSQQQIEEQIRKRNAVTETDATEKKRLNNDDESKKDKGKQMMQGKKKKQEKETGEKKELHPYKGKHIDIKW